MPETMVNLYSEELDENKPHTLEHANKIFAYKHKHGWELKDKNFTQNEDGIIVRTSKNTGSQTDKPGTN